MKNYFMILACLCLFSCSEAQAFDPGAISLPGNRPLQSQPVKEVTKYKMNWVGSISAFQLRIDPNTCERDVCTTRGVLSIYVREEKSGEDTFGNCSESDHRTCRFAFFQIRDLKTKELVAEIKVKKFPETDWGMGEREFHIRSVGFENSESWIPLFEN